MTELSLTGENRVRVLVVVFGILLVFLSIRLFLMQTLEHEKYYQMSEENRIRIVPEIAFRGVVYDRHGEAIVENRPSYAISAIPSEIDNANLISKRLSEVLSIPDTVIANAIKSQRFLRYQPIRIARSVDFETVCKIEENASKYPGIIFQLEPARKYPTDGAVSHAIGYTSEVSEKELEKYKDEGINRSTEIGRDGVEKYWDRYLRGRDGLSFLEITAEGKILGHLDEKPDIPSEPGSDIVLSLDYELQEYAASLFSDSLAGACIAIDPRNGEVLAFISMPTYDANMFAGVLKKADWDGLISNSQKPLLNRVIKGEYPPGSTYKLVLAGAALEEGIITPETKFGACRGAYRFGNRTYHCWYAPGHGALGVVGAIIQSCDIYFYQLGQKVGYNKFAEYSRKCGFGSKTGIDIPGELGGLIPDVDWYDKHYGKGKWPKSLIINLSIGQGEILVTPLQLANFYAALGNGGILYRPHFLKAVINGSDTIPTKVETIGHLPFSPSTMAILKEACVGVVYAPHGTAGASRIEGIKFGGKTGTAQNSHGREHAWFCAFAPADNPVIAVATLVEQAGHGSTISAPIASKVIRHYLEKQGIIPAKDSVKIIVNAGEGD